ncbi:hypothetical protein [Geoglobus sp.]
MRWYEMFAALAVLALLPALVTANGGMMDDDSDHHMMYMNQTEYMNQSMNGTGNATYMPNTPGMRGYDDDEDDDEHRKDIAEENRERMMERYEERHEERLEKMKEYRERLMEREEHIKEMKERYRERYEEEKEYYEMIKHRGLGDPEVFRYAKGFVVDGIGFAYAHIELLEAKIIAMNLSDNTTAELLSEIEQLKANLEEWKATINNSTTPEELRNNVNAFKEEWELTRIKIQAMVAKVVALKFEEVIEKAEERSWVIEDKISKLEELGIETEDIREAYQEYLDGLAKAKAEIAVALQHFDNAITAPTYELAKEEYEEGKDAYHEAKDVFSDSMDELRDVFKEYAERMREMSEVMPAGGNMTTGTTATPTATPVNETVTNSTT